MGRKRIWHIGMLLGISMTGAVDAQNLGEYGLGAQNPLSNTSIVQGMLDMMQLMRQMGSGAASGSQPVPGWGSPSAYLPQFGWSPADWYAQGMQMWPRMADSTRWGDWFSGYGQGWSPFPGGSGLGMLEGSWQGSTGEWLLISGDHFEIRSSQGSARGRLVVLRDRLYTYSPELGTTLEYELAVDRDRLALRDAYGQLLLFRRASIPGSPWMDWVPGSGAAAYGSQYSHPYAIP